MKTLSNISTAFNSNLNSALKFKNFFLTLAGSAFILMATCSCARNSASGCGTWPMANSKTTKNFKGESKSSGIYKNNKQFASYKRYN